MVRRQEPSAFTDVTTWVTADRQTDIQTYRDIRTQTDRHTDIEHRHTESELFDGTETGAFSIH